MAVSSWMTRKRNYSFSAQPFNPSLRPFQMEVMLCKKESVNLQCAEATAICQTGLITRSLNNSIKKSKRSLSYPRGTIEPDNSTVRAVSTTATAEHPAQQPCTQPGLPGEAAARVRAHCQFVVLAPNPCWAGTLKSVPLRVMTALGGLIKDQQILGMGGSQMELSGGGGLFWIS